MYFFNTEKKKQTLVSILTKSGFFFFFFFLLKEKKKKYEEENSVAKPERTHRFQGHKLNSSLKTVTSWQGKQARGTGGPDTDPEVALNCKNSLGNPGDHPNPDSGLGETGGGLTPGGEDALPGSARPRYP